ncbi:CapA family protein [Halalkalibacillus halophilus]|uniref:CapA family protein n=1 Tax=Halalkalibacillus halophilus TaxID=392827 RepID=UPI00040ABA02|nr:CapA family protein [Halalkalibacillus halophilus]
MRSRNRRRKSNQLKIPLIIIASLLAVIAILFFVQTDYLNEENETTDPAPSESEEPSDDPDEEDASEEEPEDNKDSEEEESPESNEEPSEEEDESVRITAVGDIMVHDTQLESAYDSESDSYDFQPFFEDIRPYMQDADLAIANLETTLAGPSIDYVGYPFFNSPDEIVDALDYAGFDTLITSNNHSLDTGRDGLIRTHEVIQEKGLEPIGTYPSEPSTRVAIKNVEGIDIAILSYTEMVNQVETQYSNEELNTMLNLIDEQQILSDIEEAKEYEPDLILAYMHWGTEYEREPKELQTRVAEMMAQEGVDVILGSHPHVIQRSDFIEGDEQETFVAYSMGNFVSNQRVETLGDEYQPTEDGVIVNLDVVKDEETGDTSIEEVEYVPTWVYRFQEDGENRYRYRVLPIEDHLEDDDLPEDIQERLEESYQETRSRMDE